MSIKPYGDLGYFGIWPLQENSDQKLLQSNRFHRPLRSSAVCLIQNVKKKSNKMDLIVATGCCATATTGPWFRNLWTKCKKKRHNLRGTFTPVDNEPMKVQFIRKIFLAPKVPGNMHWKQIVSTPTSTHAHRKRGDEHRHAHYDMYANHLNTI